MTKENILKADKVQIKPKIYELEKEVYLSEREFKEKLKKDCVRRILLVVKQYNLLIVNTPTNISFKYQNKSVKDNYSCKECQKGIMSSHIFDVIDDYYIKGRALGQINALIKIGSITSKDFERYKLQIISEEDLK